MFDNILYFHRDNCKHSQKIKLLLKKKSKKLFCIVSKKNKENLDLSKIKNIEFDYIFSFRSFFILKKNILKKVRYASINFHPGTPKYRGIGCINFALYRNEKKYGSTAHIMDERIDAGKIIDVRYFVIKKNDTLTKCLSKTYSIMYNQAIFIISELIKNKDKLDILKKKNNKVKWSKKLYTRKELNKLYVINLNCSDKIIKKKIRATKLNKSTKFNITFIKQKNKVS